MALRNFTAKIRYWDNLAAKWLMRHFYFMFFQVVLFIVFLFWFVNMFHVIDVNSQISPAPQTSLLERAMITQSVNSTIMVLLLLLNSFWMLYIFNGIQRITNILKDVSYNINRLRTRK